MATSINYNAYTVATTSIGHIEFSVFFISANYNIPRYIEHSKLGK